MRRFPLLLLVTAISSAWAAEEATSTLPVIVIQSVPSLPGSLEESVQAGNKTDTPIRDLPASVVVVPKAVLRDQGITDMNQAMTQVSGVQPVMGGGYGFANNYAIRGQAMRFLRDGYPDGTSQNGYWHTFADVDRIEVLKGPGSALYGAGQPGGTINVVTKMPRRDAGVELSATVGSFGTYNTTADATGPISSQLTGRLIVNTEKTDGWRQLSRDITEVLPTFTWRVNESSTLTVDYDHRQLNVTPDNYGLPFDAHGQIVPVSRETQYYSPFNYSRQTIDRLTLGHEWFQSTDLTVHTTLIQDRRSLDMVRNAGGNPGNSANAMTGRTVRRQTDDAHYLTLQNEAVWKTGGPAAHHTVLGGIELTDTQADTVRIGYNLPTISNVYAPVVPETALPATAVAAQGFDRTISSRGVALYAQDQMALGDQFKVRAGLRTERMRVQDEGVQAGTARTVKDTVSFTTGSLGAVWQPVPTTSLYAGWSNGQFVNLSTEPARVSSSADLRTVQPEGSTQIELGAKLSWLEGKLDLTSALFKTERTDYYITLPGATDPTPDGSDETKGLEVDLTARPMAGWMTTANLVVQDAQTTSNTRASNAQLGITNASIAGKRPTGVANTAARLWSVYRLQSAKLRGFGLGAGVTYKGASYADSLNLYRTPSYVVIDGQLFYETPSWDVNLALRNLADRRYYTNATFSGALPGEGRGAFLTARVRF
ncbi:MAG: TonB-dependent receptor [Acidobacteriota bacterium]